MEAAEKMEENSSNMQVAQKHICASNSGAKFDKGLRKARLSNTLQRLKRDGHPLQSLKPPFGKVWFICGRQGKEDFGSGDVRCTQMPFSSFFSYDEALRQREFPWGFQATLSLLKVSYMGTVQQLNI